MRVLVRILLLGTAAFLLLAIAQEWKFFSSSWFGNSPTAVVLSESERERGIETVRQFLILAAHFYKSGGDPRFAERIPASDAVVSEMLSDIEYLKRNGRRQEPLLQRLEILAIDSQGGGRLTVWTKEYWVYGTYFFTTGEEADPPRSQILHMRYLVLRRSPQWQVTAWEFEEAPPAGQVPSPRDSAGAAGGEAEINPSGSADTED